MDWEKATQKAAENFNYLAELILEKNPRANIDLIKKAYDFCITKHAGVKRASGEPYYYHPLSVGIILLENNIAETSVLGAALLHDVVEDTNVTVDEIKTLFGEEIARLVEGLTHINKEHFKNLDEYQSENLKKIILATAKDVRVMFIKLADRLHNMRTLSVREPEKQTKVAKQTLHVFAPIAEKIGLYAIKSELEDLSFLYLDPEMYQYISKKIELTKHEREKKTKEIVQFISELLKKHNIEYKITGRAKNLFSINKKIVKENKTIDQIYDLYGIRIIVSKKEECYIIKNILEELWEVEKDKITGLPRIKDFIEHPKPNGYQSLHINFRYEGKIIEVQIRTRDMDNIAEIGVAKHWRYKASERDKKLDKKMDFLRQMLQWKLNPLNFKAAEDYKIDVFGGEIVCVTPKGDPIILKEGATPLDFAYAIHSKIGDHYEQAEVNGKIALIDQKLNSGDIVNIITAKSRTANKQWFNYIITGEAKHKLRQTLNVDTEEQKKPKQKKPRELIENFEEFQLASKIEVLGKKYPVKISKCCSPNFNDEIIGYATKDKKITIHKKNCPDRFALDQRSEIKVTWMKEKKPEMELFILSEDIPGALKDILDTFLKKGVEVITISSEEVKKNILMSLKIKKNHLEKINEAVTAVKNIKGVIEVKID
jgi:guanosine-3',5'-bis(diphosphate) 3'-pyrophosphohydrolase